jgi:hypothetical protein
MTDSYRTASSSNILARRTFMKKKLRSSPTLGFLFILSVMALSEGVDSRAIASPIVVTIDVVADTFSFGGGPDTGIVGSSGGTSSGAIEWFGGVGSPFVGFIVPGLTTARNALGDVPSGPGSFLQILFDGGKTTVTGARFRQLYLSRADASVEVVGNPGVLISYASEPADLKAAIEATMGGLTIPAVEGVRFEPVTFITIPEPGSISLMAMGSLGLMGFHSVRKRRRHRN